MEDVVRGSSGDTKKARKQGVPCPGGHGTPQRHTASKLQTSVSYKRKDTIIQDRLDKSSTDVRSFLVKRRGGDAAGSSRSKRYLGKNFDTGPGKEMLSRMKKEVSPDEEDRMQQEG